MGCLSWEYAFAWRDEGSWVLAQKDWGLEAEPLYPTTPFLSNCMWYQIWFILGFCGFFSLLSIWKLWPLDRMTSRGLLQKAAEKPSLKRREDSVFWLTSTATSASTCTSTMFRSVAWIQPNETPEMESNGRSECCKQLKRHLGTL